MQKGTEVNVELDPENRQIVITLVDPLAMAGVDQEFARQVAEFIEQYRPALQQLAK
jgi:hypothetical protein